MSRLSIALLAASIAFLSTTIAFMAAFSLTLPAAAGRSLALACFIAGFDFYVWGPLSAVFGHSGRARDPSRESFTHFIIRDFATMYAVGTFIFLALIVFVSLLA